MLYRGISVRRDRDVMDGECFVPGALYAGVAVVDEALDEGVEKARDEAKSCGMSDGIAIQVDGE